MGVSNSQNTSHTLGYFKLFYGDRMGYDVFKGVKMIFGGVCKSGILPNGNFNRGHDDKASNLGVTLFRQVTNPYSIS
jgi:hypothetical protein